MAISGTIIGVILAILANTIQSFGFILQKKGHESVKLFNKDKSKEEQKTVITSWFWILGLSLYAVGGITGVVALNFAPQSIVTPIGAWTLVMTAILSYFFLKEKLIFEDIIGILLIIAGNVVIVVFGPVSNDESLTVKQLAKLYGYIDFIVMTSILIVAVIGVFIAVKLLERKNFNSNETNNEVKFGATFLMFGYTFIAAFFGGYLVLFQKSFIFILTSSFDGNFKDNFKQFLTYFVIVGFPGCLLLMEIYRQKALSYFGALYVVPIFNVLSLILSTFSGAVYFREIYTISGLKLAMFLIGILVTLIGVFILAWDVGKLLKDLGEFIQVSLQNKDKFMDEHQDCDLIPVYPGYIAHRLQKYYLDKDSFASNPTKQMIVSDQQTSSKDI